MDYSPIEGESEPRAVTRRPDVVVKLSPKQVHKPSRPPGAPERIATLMIARHGADAAREATVRLNRMIDRGNLPARDLWAWVVHVIHERRV